MPAGLDVGPLAGVPFAVKNLFDVAGLPTRAGSKINRDRAPAARDATLIERLEAAGAMLVGALNMGEYAYDFTGENVHDGASRNPHDLSRMSGGSSGGSGSAVGGGLVPLALGSDTNGSIRVPSSFCGIFGLKPTYGRLSRARYLSVRRKPRSSRAVRAQCARSRAVLRRDAGTGRMKMPAAPTRPVEPVAAQLDDGREGLRIAIAGGYFAQGRCFRKRARRSLGWPKRCPPGREIELPEAARARAAAYVITTCEGAALHLDRLRTRAADFDPGGARPADRRRA